MDLGRLPQDVDAAQALFYAANRGVENFTGQFPKAGEVEEPGICQLRQTPPCRLKVACCGEADGGKVLFPSL